MSVPFWKRWLSYLSDVPLEESSSEHNPYLRVSLSKGRYMLTTPGAIYSYGDLYTNFFYAFRALDLSRLSGREVLLLGLGLGSIPEMLEKRFDRKYRYTAVEIDDTVNWLAHQFVLQYLDSPIQLITADARVYLAQRTQTFDLVCMDVFQDDQVPEAMETESFLEMLKESLRPGGLLLFNRLAMTSDDRKATRRFYEEVFLRSFPDGGYFNARTNWLLTNHPEWFRRSEGGN